MKFFRAILFAVLLSSPAVVLAFGEAGIQGTFAAQGLTEQSFKGRSYLVLGGDGFYVGPVGYYSRPYTGYFEWMYGLGVRFGEEFRVTIEGGQFQREVFGLYAKGFSGGIVLGMELSKHWVLSVPIYYRDINEGDLSKRIEVNFLPYIGVSVDL